MRKLATSAPARSDLRDIRDDPFRPGSKERPEIVENIRSYHTVVNRDRAGSGVKSPRHFSLYFLPRDDELVVSRVLQDSHDLARHVSGHHLEQARSITVRR